MVLLLDESEDWFDSWLVSPLTGRLRSRHW